MREEDYVRVHGRSCSLFCLPRGAQDLRCYILPVPKGGTRLRHTHAFTPRLGNLQETADHECSCHPVPLYEGVPEDDY